MDINTKLQTVDHYKNTKMSDTKPKDVLEKLSTNTQIEDDPTLQSKSEFTAQSILTLLGASGITFCTVGFMNAFGVFETYYATSILSNESDSNISWLATINIFLLFAGSLMTGRILDVSGPAAMLWLGSFIIVFSIMMVSLCKTYWQFVLAQGILLGTGETLLLCPALALIPQFFKKNLSFAVGCTIAGSSLGGVVWPIVVHSLLEKTDVDFAWTMRICGFIMLPILSGASLVTRPPQKEMLLTAAAFFFAYFGMFMPFFYITDYALALGVSSDLSFYTVSIVNGASLFGRILPGLVADKYGIFNLCILMTALAGLVAFCWTTVSSVAGLVLFCMAYGFTSGGILSLQQACAAQISTPNSRGTAMGFVMTSTSLSALASAPIGGQLIEEYGYLSLSLYCGLSLLLAATVLSAARFSQNRVLRAAV